MLFGMKNILILYLQLKESDVEEPIVKIKISGGGARMSLTSSLFVCSFSIIDKDQQMLSHAGM